MSIKITFIPTTSENIRLMSFKDPTSIASDLPSLSTLLFIFGGDSIDDVPQIIFSS